MKHLATLLLSAIAATASAQAPSGLDGTWKGTLELGPMKLNMEITLNQKPDAKTATLSVPEQGAKDQPLQVNYMEGDSISLSLPEAGLNYRGRRDGDVIKGQFIQMGYQTNLELKRGEKTVAKRPQTPQAPLPYSTEDVKFDNPSAPGVTLAGTITYPVGYNKKKPVPVVLMVTGSGQQDRNEEIFDHKPFLVLADFLARNGIASLRYDDRGTAASTGTFKGSTTADFEGDAKAGLDYLRATKKFAQVGVIGHSEGGSIAFRLGAKKLCDFIVTMGAPAMKGDTLLAMQTMAVLKQKGMDIGNVSTSMIRQQMSMVNDPWTNYFMDYDPTGDISKTTIPVMALGGELDFQVPVNGNLSRIKELLGGKNPNDEFKTYPALNHLMQHAKTGYGDEYYTIEETMSPEVMQDIANWIKKTSKK